MISEIRSFALVASDPAASEAYYTQVLGGVVVDRRDGAVTVQIAKGLLEILDLALVPGGSPGMSHLTLTSTALDADHARLAASYRTVSDPADAPVGRHSFLLDPNGVVVELLEGAHAVRGPVVEHDIVETFDHYSVFANDLVAAERFYGDSLGMTKISEVTAGSTFTYYAFDYDTVQLVKRPRIVDTIYDHFAFRVGNIDETVAYMAAKGHGAKFVSAKNGDAYRAGAGAVYLDPDGIEIEFLDRPDVRQLGFGPFS